jgi:hypothetical protein
MKKRLGLKKITLKTVDDGDLAGVAGAGFLSLGNCSHRPDYSCGTDCQAYSCPNTACDCPTAPQFYSCPAGCTDTCNSCGGTCGTCDDTCNGGFSCGRFRCQ